MCVCVPTWCVVLPQLCVYIYMYTLPPPPPMGGTAPPPASSLCVCCCGVCVPRSGRDFFALGSLSLGTRLSAATTHTHTHRRTDGRTWVSLCTSRRRVWCNCADDTRPRRRRNVIYVYNSGAAGAAGAAAAAAAAANPVALYTCIGKNIIFVRRRRRRRAETGYTHTQAHTVVQVVHAHHSLGGKWRWKNKKKKR